MNVKNTLPRISKRERLPDWQRLADKVLATDTGK
jgi:hypothetical protein